MAQKGQYKRHFVLTFVPDFDIIEWRFEMINFGHETEELEFKKSTSEMHDAINLKLLRIARR